MNFKPDCKGPEGKRGDFICAICKLKGELRNRRASISRMVGTGNYSGMALQREWTQRYELIVEDSFWDCMPSRVPPCQFALCLAGSGARHEASPFSDLDSFVLVADDSPSKVAFFRTTFENMDALFRGAEGTSGLRLCTVMTPLGGNTAAEPALIRTPHNMAALVEWAPGAVVEHIVQGLQEHRFMCGHQRLYDEFKTDLNLITGRNCFRFSSRPVITERKRRGLQVIKDVVNDPMYQPPAQTAWGFHVKEQFYRPVQFIAKGLAWYYGVTAMGVAEQCAELVRNNDMSQTVANNFSAVMNAMASLRFKLHLDREGEKDFVYTNRQARDAEILQIQQKPTAERADRERRARLEQGVELTRNEAKALTDSIANLAYIMRLGRSFVAQKEKTFGKRQNPFATGKP